MLIYHSIYIWSHHQSGWVDWSRTKLQCAKNYTIADSSLSLPICYQARLMIACRERKRKNRKKGSNRMQKKMYVRLSLVRINKYMYLRKKNWKRHTTGASGYKVYDCWSVVFFYIWYTDFWIIFKFIFRKENISTIWFFFVSNPLQYYEPLPFPKIQ